MPRENFIEHMREAQERAPGHQEEQAGLQQWELPKFGELGDVADG